jgi:hypothetical protein
VGLCIVVNGPVQFRCVLGSVEARPAGVGAMKRTRGDRGLSQGQLRGTSKTIWIIILFCVLVSWQSSQHVRAHSQARCGRGHAQQ